MDVWHQFLTLRTTRKIADINGPRAKAPKSSNKRQQRQRLRTNRNSADVYGQAVATSTDEPQQRQRPWTDRNRAGVYGQRQQRQRRRTNRKRQRLGRTAMRQRLRAKGNNANVHGQTATAPMSTDKGCSGDVYG